MNNKGATIAVSKPKEENWLKTKQNKKYVMYLPGGTAMIIYITQKRERGQNIPNHGQR